MYRLPSPREASEYAAQSPLCRASATARRNRSRRGRAPRGAGPAGRRCRRSPRRRAWRPPRTGRRPARWPCSRGRRPMPHLQAGAWVSPPVSACGLPSSSDISSSEVSSAGSIPSARMAARRRAPRSGEQLAAPVLGRAGDSDMSRTDCHSTSPSLPGAPPGSPRPRRLVAVGDCRGDPPAPRVRRTGGLRRGFRMCGLREIIAGEAVCVQNSVRCHYIRRRLGRHSFARSLSWVSHAFRRQCAGCLQKQEPFIFLRFVHPAPPTGDRRIPPPAAAACSRSSGPGRLPPVEHRHLGRDPGAVLAGHTLVGLAAAALLFGAFLRVHLLRAGARARRAAGRRSPAPAGARRGAGHPRGGAGAVRPGVGARGGVDAPGPRPPGDVPPLRGAHPDGGGEADGGALRHGGGAAGGGVVFRGLVQRRWSSAGAPRRPSASPRCSSRWSTPSPGCSHPPPPGAGLRLRGVRHALHLGGSAAPRGQQLARGAGHRRGGPGASPTVWRTGFTGDFWFALAMLVLAALGGPRPRRAAPAGRPRAAPAAGSR